MPLSRFTVLDLTRVRAGPTAVRQLADWGAKVIKIEAPPEPGAGEAMGGPRHGPDFQNLHRNKRSLTLDLKSPEGIEIFRKLVRARRCPRRELPPRRQNPARHRLCRAAAAQPAPRLCQHLGLRPSGPYRDRPGFDQIAQGMGGLMSITGLPGQGPVRVGIPIADLSAGIFTAMGILVALLEREVSGEGQWVESSLLAAQIAMLDFQAARWLIAARGAGAGRQRPPDQHPDRRLQDEGRPYQHRLGRRRDLSPAVPGARRAGARGPRRITGPAGCARKTARRSTPRSRRSPRARQRRVDRAVQRGRRAGRADLLDQRGLRRPAGQASRDRPAGRASRRSAASNWSARR